jgi:crotonobetaine/carnitine-CoA ligase
LDIIGNQTLRSYWEERVECFPDKEFLVFEGPDGHLECFTYRDIDFRINQFAQMCLDLGITKGDKVNVHLPNCPEFYFAWLGLAKIGAVIVPTNILHTPHEMEFLLQHSGTKMVLVAPEQLELIRQVKPLCPKLQYIISTGSQEQEGALNLTNLMNRQSGDLEPCELKTEDAAAILYTSGTTSKPKGVIITHGNYIFAGEAMSRSIALQSHDRQLIVLPLFHGNAQYYSSMSAISVGGSIGLTHRFSASRYFKQAKRLGATVGSLFAAPIRMILGQSYDLEDRENPIRLIWFAQALSENQLTQFEEKYQVQLLQLYGMTETIGTPLMNPLIGKKDNQSIGRPTLYYQVRLVNEEGVDVSPGEAGQIIVKGIPGRTIMKEYYQNEEATKLTIRDGWLYTGDKARLDENGFYYFVDRVKDMIKRSGENVAANEVELIINQHPKVYESAVVGIPDPIRDETIKAFVILKPGEKMKEEELINYCRLHLSKFKVPEFVEFVTDFPRTSVGKIQKHLLKIKGVQPC